MRVRTYLPLLLLTASCRVLPHDEVPDPSFELSENFAGPASNEPIPEIAWWDTFSPDVAGYVEQALIENRDLRAGAARVQAAAARARIAGADLLPTLGASGNGSRLKQIFVGLPVPGSNVLESTTYNYGVSLDLSWEADLWGRLSALSDAADEDFVASASDYRAAQHSLAAQTAKAWFAWQAARTQLAHAENSLSSFERTRNLVTRRFENGNATAFDVQLTETDYAQANALAEARREQRELSILQLEVLIGSVPEGDLVTELDDDRLPPTPPIPSVGVPGDLLARRPDLVAAEARVHAADDRLYAARAALYPQLSLTGSVGRASDSASDLFDDDFSVWSIAAGITQPIFQGGRLRAQIEASDAELAAALADFESQLLFALGEVETALVSENRLGELERLRTEAKERADNARSLAEDRYRAGRLDLLEVLTAERRALQAAIDLTDIRQRRLETRVDLYLALGGGFVPTETEE